MEAVLGLLSLSLIVYVLVIQIKYKKIVVYLRGRIDHYKYYKKQYNNLVGAVRQYIRADGHDLCWQNKMDLARAVGIYIDEKKYVPPMDEFISNCVKYRQSLDKPTN